jgi:hypothetical protein
VAHGVKNDFHPLASNELERRHKIAVRCHDDDCADELSKGEPSHVQPDPKVHTLLSDIEIKIIVLQRSWSSLQFPGAAAAELPLVTGEDQLTHAQRHVWHGSSFECSFCGSM